MRYNYLFIPLAAALLSGCEINIEPSYYDTYVPESILTRDGFGQEFRYGYDTYVTEWKNTTPTSKVYAKYYYRGGNEIEISSVYSPDPAHPEIKYTYYETLHLDRGVAVSADGKMYHEDYRNGYLETNVSNYHLDFFYDYDGHLTEIYHKEAWGERYDAQWTNAWSWRDYLVWDDRDNLSEYQDFDGGNSVRYATLYEYAPLYANYQPEPPIIVNIHYQPLQTQGFFGRMPKNLIAQSLKIDRSSGETWRRNYQYYFEGDMMTGYDRATYSNNVPIFRDAFYINWMPL